MAIDHFGTGRSSVGYLRPVPVSALKLDRRFVQEIARGRGATAAAILAMARQLGIAVVADGVEIEEQERFLREHGCQYARGYRYGKPMPAESFAEFLRRA